ncbi:MAG: hypothetical protein JWQ09_3689 [Segetibacter sp.]|nr:hypothetical protein [Segetibacter sp.]
MNEDKLLMQLVDSKGTPQQNIFERIKVLADPSTPGEFPKYTTMEDLGNGTFFLRQILPAQEPEKYHADKGHPKDKAFSLTLQVNNPLTKTERINWSGNIEKMGMLEATISPKETFAAVVSLHEGLNTAVERKLSPQKLTENLFAETLAKNTIIWNKYWNQSGVKLSDAFLEQTWYRNLYFFNCATKEDATCPGLFANWSYNNIGTAWHGDYHLNYNLQQPFWLPFSSNHLEKNIAYVNLIEHLMPVSRSWAKEYYNLPGAYFPHSAFPVEMTMNPYPIPDWDGK